MQFVSTVLQSTDADAYDLFARLPTTVTYWVDIDANVDALSIGTGVHETTHTIDRVLSTICTSDGLRRYRLGAQWYVSNLTVVPSTANYSIAAETLPPNLKPSAPSRYQQYVIGSVSVAGNDFAILLDELTAYTNGARTEGGIAASAQYDYLAPAAKGMHSNANAGGAADFMSYLVAYLRAARVNHPATYAALQTQPQTLAYITSLWAAAEQALVNIYPYTDNASGTAGYDVSAAALAWAYTPAQLAELDALGIGHGSSTIWATTYLKP
jgi:hypothetical protein